jgi:putative phosphoribosyl transferase
MVDRAPQERTRTITIPPVGLEGLLGLPTRARGIVLFAHGSGSGRFSPRNNFVAQALRVAGLATLLFDLLIPDEAQDRRNVFDISLLAQRLSMAGAWVRDDAETTRLPIGYLGASTGAAAALVAAAADQGRVAAIVSRGGRPDLAGSALGSVRAPTC